MKAHDHVKRTGWTTATGLLLVASVGAGVAFDKLDLANIPTAAIAGAVALFGLYLAFPRRFEDWSKRAKKLLPG